MKTPFSRSRRLLIAIVSLLAAAILFRSQIAEALVIRGDDFLYRGRSDLALGEYARALFLDSDLKAAVDRFVFVSMERHDPRSVEQGISAANGYLQRHPNDSEVLADRAMCYLVARRYLQSERDFARAARASSGAIDFVFAGWSAAHAGNMTAARTLWSAALAVSPGFVPAKLALREHFR